MTENNDAAVYTRMLRDYRAAADKLLVRQKAVREEHRQIARGAPDPRERELEARIRLLREEYTDLLEIIEQIRGYAAREGLS